MQEFDREEFARLIIERQKSEGSSIPEIARRLGLGKTTLARLRAATGALPNVTTYLKVKAWIQSPLPQPEEQHA